MHDKSVKTKVMSTHLIMGNETFESETIESEEIQQNGVVTSPIQFADNNEKMR